MSLADFDNSPANAFSVTIDGIQVPRVIEVTGLKTEVDKIELKQQIEGGKFVSTQVPGRRKGGQELSITRGLTESKTVTDWLKTVMEGDVAGARKTAAVSLLDYKGETLKTYNFTNCWVKSVEINSLKAGATEQATEKFVICYDESTVS